MLRSLIFARTAFRPLAACLSSMSPQWDEIHGQGNRPIVALIKKKLRLLLLLRIFIGPLGLGSSYARTKANKEAPWQSVQAFADVKDIATLSEVRLKKQFQGPKPTSICVIVLPDDGEDDRRNFGQRRRVS